MEHRPEYMYQNTLMYKSDWNEGYKPIPLEEQLKTYYGYPEHIRKDMELPTKENCTYFDEMIALKLKTLSYEQKGQAWVLLILWESLKVFESFVPECSLHDSPILICNSCRY